MSTLNQILKDDWYKTASPQEMRVALMHLQMEVSDHTLNCMADKQKKIREQYFESCAEANGWNKKDQE